MITHRVIDLAFTEAEGNVEMNGSYEECMKFVSSQNDYFTYKIEPLLPHEIASLNAYDNALKKGKNYLKTGKL